MIPTIEDILDDVARGVMDVAQALTYINAHMCNDEMRDHFAAMALPALIEKMGYRGREYSEYAKDAYGYADAMMQVRKP